MDLFSSRFGPENGEKLLKTTSFDSIVPNFFLIGRISERGIYHFVAREKFYRSIYVKSYD